MAEFCLLSDPENYVAHDWDLVSDEAGRDYWLDHFATQFKMTLKHAMDKYGQHIEGAEKVRTAEKQFNRILELLRLGPDSLPGGKLGVLELCRLREMALRENDIGDPFSKLKERQNRDAVQLYSRILDKYGKLRDQEKWLELVKGVFAGNLFDLGSPAGMETPDTPPDFFKSFDEVKPRPWLIDDFDAFFEDLSKETGSWQKALVFVDNAGSDFVLGLIPLLKELATGGTAIVLTANELPSLNDLTVDETLTCLEEITMVDMDLGILLNDNMFNVVSNGNDLPLIDLSRVSDDLNAAAADVDLVIIEGMGRGIESNFEAAFKVDTLRLAVLKDTEVASRVGGELFDCICKYRRAK